MLFVTAKATVIRPKEAIIGDIEKPKRNKLCCVDVAKLKTYFLKKKKNIFLPLLTVSFRQRGATIKDLDSTNTMLSRPAITAIILYW